MTCIELESVGEKEIQEEVLKDGLFVNTPRVIFNEWFEKCFISNEESECLPMVLKLNVVALYKL